MATITFSLLNLDNEAGGPNGIINGAANAGGTGYTVNDGLPGTTNDISVGATVTITSNDGPPASQNFTATYDGLTAGGLPVFTLDTSDVGFIPNGSIGILSETDLTGQFSAVVNTGDFTVCFAAGSLIATPKGERAVETLAIGDLVTTADGRTVPVKWIGRQTVQKFFTPADQFAPVRITAGALGDGLPHADLRLTACHGLVIDGVLINAGALVNGTTILRESKAELPDRMTYWHVETEDHDVILANGAPAETFISKASRERFDNYAEYLALYGDVADRPELDMPRVSAARLVPTHIRARLDGKVAA